MKRIVSLVIMVMLAGTLAHAQQGWVDHKIDNKVSLKFPFTPKELVAGSFIAISPDSSSVYISTLVDFATAAGLDSATLTPLETNPDFLSQLKAGLKQSLPKVDLADFTLSKFKEYNCYTTSGFDDKKKRYDMFMFIIGTNFYSISVVSKEGVSLAMRDKFFATVMVTK